MFVMRRANGGLYNEERNGKMRIPVWPSDETLARYRERNPELMTFLPTRLTRSLIDRIVTGLTGGATTEFFLLAEDGPDADLDDGRPISLEEILSGAEQHPQPAQLQR
jgi:hypothetical protein